MGRGRGVAALFNGRARQVTPKVVEAFARALPEALVLVSRDEAEARRHASAIARAKPRLLLSGGGDGAAVMLLNLLREEGVTEFPPLGVLKLGTGNAWARTMGALPVFAMGELLPRLSWPLPTQRFRLLEVEGRLAHFAGVGWDARILNDYQRVADARAPRELRRLRSGFAAYLFSLARYTIPGEIAAYRDRPHGRIEADGPAFTLDTRAHPHRSGGVLYEGPLSVCAAATTPEFGYGIRAFPFATVMPGFLNVRVYDKDILQALWDVPRLWRGAWPEGGVHDFFVRKLVARFDRPLPFQIGGDPAGARMEISVALSNQLVDAVDWRAATERAGMA